MANNAPAPAGAIPGFRIPVPWDSKGSPSFDNRTADSLVKYLRFTKVIIASAGITDDPGKKEVVLKYLHTHTAEEFEALETYDNGTFEEWIEEIEALYPEIKSQRLGSLARLDDICAKYQNLTKKNQGEIKRLSLAFKVEADKLKKPPSLVLNGSLVERYLKCFEPAFVVEINIMISQRLLEKLSQPAANPAVPPVLQRPEETIPLEDLIVLVGQLSQINIGAATVTNLTSTVIPSLASLIPSTQEAGRMIKLEEMMSLQGQDVALLKDTMKVAQTQYKSDLNELRKESSSHFSELTQHMKQFETALNQSAGRGRDAPPHQDIVQAGQASNRYGEERRLGSGSFENRPCYYCLLTGHVIRDCPYKKEHIDLAMIVIEGNRMKLGDKTPFPRYPDNKSQKQRVDDYWRNRPAPNGAVVVPRLLYEHPQVTPQTQFHSDLVDNLSAVYDYRDDEIRCLNVQIVIRETLAQSVYNHPVATFQQSQVSNQPYYGGQQALQPQFQQQQFGGQQGNAQGFSQPQYAPSQGNVQNYAPQHQFIQQPMNVQTYAPQQQAVPSQGNVQAYAPQVLEFPVISQAAPSVSVPDGSIDLRQIVQFSQMVESLRGLNLAGLPTTQDQFVATTRSGAGAQRSASPN